MPTVETAPGTTTCTTSAAYLNNRGEFVVAVVGDRIVGMGALRPISETVGEIKRMRVHPDYQRRGIGQRIYDLLEARARELGYRTLRLDTTENLTAAVGLYTKNGFVEVERKPWRHLEMVFFEKELVQDGIDPAAHPV